MVYVRVSDGRLIQFEGMTQEQITAMLADQGLTCEFLDQATYLAAKPKPE